MWEEEKDCTAPEVKEETVEYQPTITTTNTIPHIKSKDEEKHRQIFREFKIACDAPMAEWVTESIIIVTDLRTLWDNIPQIETNIEYAASKWKTIVFARYKNDIQISWKKVD